MVVPIKFGKYLLLDRINVGGMGEVFKAKAFGVKGFERIIAIKRILPNIAEDEELITMFVDEARIAAQLSHPNIVQIYELGTISNQYYIAMEYIPGKDLRQILNSNHKQGKTVPVAAAAYITAKLCEGLDYAHRKTDPAGKPLHIIHRDISPQNILVSFDGTVKITDFGIARAEDRVSRTQAGVIKGKFGYMSPEQVRGLTIDHRSDIFAVGVLLYEMVTGKRLFVGGSDFSTLDRVRKAEVIPPTEHNPALPPEFEQFVMRALARDRDERYPYASDLLDDLQSFLIDGNTIFGAKHLSSMLHEDYRGDIDTEMRSMEKYMQLLPSDAPVNMDIGGKFPPGAPGENTMIFESGIERLEDAPTLFDDNTSTGHSPSLQNLQGNPVVVAGESTYGQSQPRLQPESSGQTWLGSNTRGLRRTFFGVATGVVFVVLTGMAAWLILFDGSATGTLMVTTKPVQDNLEIALNGDVVATTSPFFMEKIPSGTYSLEARATGFANRIYTVKVTPGSDAVVNVVFEKALTRIDGVATILSEPLEASVYRGNQKIGITPFTLDNLKTDETLRLTLKLDGYENTELQGKFEPGSTKLVLKGVLKPYSGQTGSMMILSEPKGAALFLDGKRIGTTPHLVGKLDPSKDYTIEVDKVGYRETELTYHSTGELHVTENITLEPLLDDRLDRSETAQNTTVRLAPRAGKDQCGGDGATLSALVVGEANCKVRVGPETAFLSPHFKAEVPVGRCRIVVTCPSGRSYRETRVIKPGDNGRLIIRPEMLK